jgi:hypothetical protein
MKEKNLLRIHHCQKTVAMHLAAVTLVCVLFPFPLKAQFAVRSVNLAYLSQRAGVIIQGQIISVRHKPLAGYPNIPTVEVTLNVERSLRGLPGRTYTFRELNMGLRSREGKQAYRTGQRLFLFLPSPSQYGLSSPIGMGQGCFRVSDDSAGRARLANEHGNAGLFRDVERDAVRGGKQLTSDQRKLASTKRGPVPLEEFVSLVKSLTTLPRIQ